MEFSASLLKSIEQLRYQATPGELSTQSGLPLAKVERDLQQLAIAVGGHLQVSTTGEIVYKYPHDLQGILRKKFLWLQVTSILEKIWRVLFYLIRISFGILLVGIAAIIALSLILIALASIFSDNGGGGGGSIDFGGGGGSGGDWGQIFVWDSGGGYYQSSASGSAAPAEVKELSFLGAVFSILFGDGNPNYNLEETRWKTIGQAIRKNRGVITAEQVAPYLENVTPHSEDHIMPVLVRFNGMPEVSPIGDIVYRFPEVQAVSQRQKFKRLPNYLKEKNWRFSMATTGQRWLIGILAAFNVSGALALGWLLKGSAVAGGLIGLVSSLYWLMLLYAVGFVTIPIGRWLWLQWVNNQVDRRNEQRRHQVALLSGQDVERKLLFADGFRSELVIEQGDIAYSTDEDLLDQEIAELDRLNSSISEEDQQQLPPRN
jgi:hypothetical protein